MTTLVQLFLDGSSSFFADNKTNHKSLDEFEFWLDSITDFGVSCP